MVRVSYTKEPVLVAPECESFEEMFSHLDEVVNPYDCEWKDVEISSKMSIVFDDCGSPMVGGLSRGQIDKEMKSDDGWLSFPEISLSSIREAESNE